MTLEETLSILNRGAAQIVPEDGLKEKLELAVKENRQFTGLI